MTKKAKTTRARIRTLKARVKAEQKKADRLGERIHTLKQKFEYQLSKLQDDRDTHVENYRLYQSGISQLESTL